MLQTLIQRKLNTYENHSRAICNYNGTRELARGSIDEKNKRFIFSLDELELVWLTKHNGVVVVELIAKKSRS